MRVLNVHQRWLPGPPEPVGALIDGLAGPDDRLWPHDRWPAIRFDRAELEVTGTVAGPARRSPWVRLLRGRLGRRKSRATRVPARG